MLRVIVVPRGKVKQKRMQKCSLSREKEGEKGSTPKCNIPRRQTVSSEIEITFIEIRNALKKT